MTTTKRISLLLLGGWGLLGLAGCEKLIDIDPPLNEVPSELVFRSDATARSAMSGAYASLSTSQAFALSLTLNGALSADELVSNRTNLDYLTTNQLDPLLSSQATSLWGDIYACIYRFNAIIKGLDNNTAVSANLRRQYTAEARFMRAYCYFYLVNYFGDVPLVLDTDVTVTNQLPRAPAASVYAQLVQDLQAAQADLPADYSASPGLRTNANRWAATALLARAALYTSDWATAERSATDVLGQTTLYSLPPGASLRNVFLRNSSEAILQLGPYQSLGNFTYEGFTFATTAANYSLRPELYNSFEATDLRRSTWTRPLAPGQQLYKYRFDGTAAGTAAGQLEYPTVLRLAEQYLIRAEARAQQNNLAGALQDLNVLRQRAGLPPLTATTTATQAAVLLAVEAERRHELFGELGHRWFDLKRTGRATPVLGALKPATWQPTDVLYPVPQAAIDANPNLTQNPGY